MKQIKSEQKGRELSEMKLINYLRNSTIPILSEVTKVNSMVLIKNTAKQIKISRYQIHEEHTKMQKDKTSQDCAWSIENSIYIMKKLIDNV